MKEYWQVTGSNVEIRYGVYTPYFYPNSQLKKENSGKMECENRPEKKVRIVKCHTQGLMSIRRKKDPAHTRKQPNGNDMDNIIKFDRRRERETWYR